MSTSTIRRTAAGAAAAVGIATAGLLATAAPASAAQTCVEAEGALGCFESYGDIVAIHADVADGLRPQVQWETDYGRYGECTYTGAYDWTVCNYNMAEGGWIAFRVVLLDGSGDIVDGTPWAQAPIGES